MESEVLYSKVHMDKNTILEYYLIIEDIAEGYHGLKSYGVRINKISRFAGGGKTVEMKQINNIFCRKDDAEGFVECISRNKVTPVTLRDVAEDYVIESLERARRSCVKI